MVLAQLDSHRIKKWNLKCHYTEKLFWDESQHLAVKGKTLKELIRECLCYLWEINVSDRTENIIIIKKEKEISFINFFYSEDLKMIRQATYWENTSKTYIWKVLISIIYKII